MPGEAGDVDLSEGGDLMTSPPRLTPPATTKRPFDVLIIDDSAVVRQTLKAMVEADPAFRAQCAVDPYEAVEVMKRVKPDAIILDVDMPRMDGLTFLKKLMRQHPLPVLLCTDYPERGIAALELGALEVIPKPNWEQAGFLEHWAAQLRGSLMLAVAPAVAPAIEPPTGGLSPSGPSQSADAVLPYRPFIATAAPRERIIAIGASTGGVQAIPRLLADLAPSLPGIVIVQHMPGGFTRAFADRLNRDPNVPLHVIEASSGDPIRPGVALVVPGTSHGVINRAASGYRLDLVDGPLVNRFRPSVDVLFRSVAQAAGPNATGVLLTGMLDDGAQGLLEMHAAGSWTIAQDEATCKVFGMPREAIRRGAAKQVLPLDRIGQALTSWAAGGTR